MHSLFIGFALIVATLLIGWGVGSILGACGNKWPESAQEAGVGE